MKNRNGRSKGTGWLVRRGANWYACWKHDGILYKRTTGTADFETVYRQLDAMDIIGLERIRAYVDNRIGILRVGL